MAPDFNLNSLNERAILHFSGYLKPWNCANIQVIRHYYAVMSYTAYINTVSDMNMVMSTISHDFHTRYDLKHTLMYVTERKNKITSILCFLYLILSGRFYNDTLRNLWLIRERIRLNYIYPGKIGVNHSN